MRSAGAVLQEFAVSARIAQGGGRPALVHALTSGRWTHDYPITASHARALGLPVTTELPTLPPTSMSEANVSA